MGYRFTPSTTNYGLYLLDKKSGRTDTGITPTPIFLKANNTDRTPPSENHNNVEINSLTDEPELPVPVWRTPQPAAHAHEDHEINVVVAGVCRFVCENKQCYTVGVGQMLAIPGGVTHTVEVDDYAMVRGFWIHPNIFRRIYGYRTNPTAVYLSEGSALLKPRLLYDASQFKTLNEVWEQSQDVLARDSIWRNEYLDALGKLAALGLVSFMQSQSRIQPGHPSHARVSNVRAWMERNYLEPVTLEQLASMAGLSISQFSCFSLVKDIFLSHHKEVAYY